MDSIKDLLSLGAVLVVQLAAWAAGVVSLFGVLPIPHTPHEWGIAFGTCVVYLLARIRDRKRVRRRISAIKRPASLAVPVAVPEAPKKRKPAATHSERMRRTATH